MDQVMDVHEFQVYVLNYLLNLIQIYLIYVYVHVLKMMKIYLLLFVQLDVIGVARRSVTFSL